MFHHVLPRDIKISGISLPRPAVTTAAGQIAESTAAAATSGNSDGKATSAGTAASSTADSSAETAGQTTAAATAATTAATTDPGAWGAKFAGHFTNGEILTTDTSYQSANISIAIKKVQDSAVTYYVADIYLRDIDYFRTAFASGKYGRGLTDDVLDMAKEKSGDPGPVRRLLRIRDRGIVIRNGELYRDTAFQDVLILYYDGSMETVTAGDFNMDKILREGAWQAWSFGPMLLTGGQPMTAFNSDVTQANPRSAIGYYEPGHYCFVLVDGRQPGYSIGMNMKDLSQLFADLGCTAAYNLDGGQSAVMTFMDQWANQPYNGGRRISDIICITENP